MITIASKISERNYCLYVLIYSIIIFTYIEIAEGWNPIFSLFGLGEWIAMLLGYHSILVIALILKWVLKLFKFNFIGCISQPFKTHFRCTVRFSLESEGNSCLRTILDSGLSLKFNWILNFFTLSSIVSMKLFWVSANFICAFFFNIQYINMHFLVILWKEKGQQALRTLIFKVLSRYIKKG